MMTWSRVFVSVILLSALLGPSIGGRPMPKLADRKLCADEECSRKSWGLGDLGAWAASLWRMPSFPSILLQTPSPWLWPFRTTWPPTVVS